MAQNAAQYFSEAFQRNSPFIVQAAFYKRYAVDQKKLQIFLKKSLTIPLRYGIFYLQLVKPNRK